MTHATVMQRAVGAVRIAARATGLDDLAQSGCLRACFPNRHGGALEAVIVNTAGGIADGDSLRVDIGAGQGSDIVVTTPSAERIYRARPNAAAARMAITLHIAPEAQLAFLPQETILFNHCALDRTLDVHMDERASYLGLEALIFGRQESAETITNVRLCDTVRVHRGGRLVLQDSVRLQGDVTTVLASRAATGGAKALATIVLATPGSAARLDGVRAALADTAVQSGASAWNGCLVTRILAQDARTLRIAVVAALGALSDTQIPRIWNS